MSLFHCRFCDHDNPPDARFCNACGSPLYLKPCPQCEAVNDSAAPQCYQCGTALPNEDIAAEASVTGMPEFAGATETTGDLGAGVYYAYEHSGARTKSADVVAAAPPNAQQQSASEVNTPSATSNEAPPPAPATPETDSTTGAAKGESATAVSTVTPRESVRPPVEPRPAAKA